MRVLWMIDSLGPGGAESLMLPLLSNLKNHPVDPRVCVLSVRAGNPITAELEKIGVPVDLVQVRNLRNFSGIARLYHYLRKNQPDIVHTQLETSDILGTLFATMFGIPTVTTLHTIDVQSRGIKKYLRNVLRWNVLKFLPKRVVVVSEFTRKHYLGYGFRPSKLLTVYNGIDLSRYSRSGTPHPSRMEVFGLPEDSTVLTTVAVLREKKGIQYMLQALPGLMHSVPNLYYVVAGDGDYRNHLEGLVQSLGIADHVVFLGHRTDIPDILAASDAFIFPSLEEALPTAILEAMAVGLPIVASRVGGVPEILEDHVSGLLVPPADANSLCEACLCFLSNSDLARQLSAAANKTVLQHFDVCQQALTLLSLYRQFISIEGSEIE